MTSFLTTAICFGCDLTNALTTAHTTQGGNESLLFLKHFKNYIYVQFVLHTTIKVEQYSEERAQGSTLRGDLGQYIYLQVSFDVWTELDSLTALLWPQCLILLTLQKDNTAAYSQEPHRTALYANKLQYVFST